MPGGASQEQDTNVSHIEAGPTLGFGQIMQVLIHLYGVQEDDYGTLRARVKKVQRSGVPLGANVGKGPRARYSLDQLFQLIVVLELSELSISLPISSEIVRSYWSNSDANLAPARAWLMHQNGDADSMLLLAAPPEPGELSNHRKESAAAQDAPVLLGAPTSPYDRLSANRLSSIISEGKLDLSRTTLPRQAWRSSLVDCSVLVPIVAHILAERAFVSKEEFTSWATERCNTLA